MGILAILGGYSVNVHALIKVIICHKLRICRTDLRASFSKNFRDIRFKADAQSSGLEMLKKGMSEVTDEGIGTSSDTYTTDEMI